MWVGVVGDFMNVMRCFAGNGTDLIGLGWVGLAFEFYPKSVSPQTGTTRACLGKCHSHSAQNFCEHL